MPKTQQNHTEITRNADLALRDLVRLLARAAAREALLAASSPPMPGEHTSAPEEATDEPEA